jgi:DNA-binding transcriptional LysR family regulator
MPKESPTFDWNQARTFLATADAGSFSAAARLLKQTQPTVGRQIAALETTLGVTLFERTGRVLILTEAGLELLEHVRAMSSAADQVSLSASGQSQSIAGQVCISVSDALSAYQLPPIVARIRQLAPEIEIEIAASNAIADLKRREADIAIRHVRPDQPDLITRLVRTTTGHLYASREFLDAVGRPQSPEDLVGLPFIGLEDNVRLLTYLNALGLALVPEQFKIVTGSGVTAWEMVKHGLGFGVMSKDVADLTPCVEVVLPDRIAVDIPLWLTTHRELHTARRIRLVFDVLAEALSEKPETQHS